MTSSHQDRVALSAPVRVGALTLPNRVFLAPLAGVSDVPFRRICRELGAGLTFVEMLNANAVLHGLRRTMRTLSRHPSERVLGVQVTGPRPDQVAAAVARLDQEGFDLIDINMGCPVRKIVSRGSGSGILKDPARLADTLRLAREATKKPLSVKVRLGFTRRDVNIEETARLAGEAGVDLFTIHGRTRSENYGTPVDYDAIELGLAAARAAGKAGLVTVGNGDILQRDAAREMVRRTGCDAVMVSRGALGNPWIFPMILDPARPEPTLDEWLDVVLRHMEYHEEFYGTDSYSVVRTRKHLLWYINGFPDARRFRERISVVQTLDDARAMLRAYCAEQPAGLRRYEAPPSEADRPPAHRYDPKHELDRLADRAAADEDA